MEKRVSEESSSGSGGGGSGAGGVYGGGFIDRVVRESVSGGGSRGGGGGGGGERNRNADRLPAYVKEEAHRNATPQHGNEVRGREDVDGVGGVGGAAGAGGGWDSSSASSIGHGHGDVQEDAVGNAGAQWSGAPTREYSKQQRSGAGGRMGMMPGREGGGVEGVKGSGDGGGGGGGVGGWNSPGGGVATSRGMQQRDGRGGGGVHAPPPPASSGSMTGREREAADKQGGGGAGTTGTTTPFGSMRWVTALKKYVGSTDQWPTAAEMEVEVRKRLKAILEEKQLQKEAKSSSINSSSSSIPSFYKRKPAENSLSGRMDTLSRLKFLKRQSEELLDGDELEVLWMALRGNTSPPVDEHTDKINYADFSQVGNLMKEQIGPKVHKFFSASVFLTFEVDDYGRIGILPFYLYIMRTVSLTQTRIDMCMLDGDGDGYLKAQEMEMYIRQLIPNLVQLQGMEASFVTVYCRIAARKFFFFNDPHRRGRLLIREVLLSPVLAELMELRQEQEASSQEDDPLSQNWFSLRSTKNLYAAFLSLDKDMNGTLSKAELLAYGDGNLTDIFIERVFDEHVKRGRGERGGARGEMDLNNFLDFVLAIENKHTPEGLSYIFRCLDLHGRGYLTILDVYTLFRAVHRKWIECGHYDLFVEDVKDEIWDMVKPKDPLKITLQDLLDCKQGDTVAAMLTDVSGFWAHDNRENLAQQEDEEEEEEEEE
ncbi:hypothetical protein CBR_g7999 [Chara braunii]|uniref:EF-hand domain-containing protein n=1 Tax=Chara braunii TaxID=69332 RepID=A0A388KKX2_CHABU|nr:hypothetical protein CBR_g7999 [Chara braunii]|eukprot:GBG70700.1 hypothetical protein CBR_g7999 [Chara braunii]